jgi:hypothetical protein
MRAASLRVFSPEPFEEPSVRALLTLLRGAYSCALLLCRPPVEFSVDLATVLSTGVAESRLLVLIEAGVIGLLRQNRAGPARRGSRRSARSVLGPRSAFVLTAAGESLLEELQAASASAPDAPPRPPARKTGPTWNPVRKELWFQGSLVKRFRRKDAANQFLILESFEELGWPEWIDDPLPHVPGIAAEQRLQETVKSLNRRQLHPALHFNVSSLRQGVRWTRIQSRD